MDLFGELDDDEVDLFGGKSNKETAALETATTTIETDADLFLADNTTQRKNESMYSSNNS